MFFKETTPWEVTHFTQVSDFAAADVDPSAGLRRASSEHRFFTSFQLAFVECVRDDLKSERGRVLGMLSRIESLDAMIGI